MEMYFFSLLYLQVKVIQDKGVLQQKEIWVDQKMTNLMMPMV